MSRADWGGLALNVVQRKATQSGVSFANTSNCTRGQVTKAKSNPLKRGMNVESTLTRLARRMQSAIETAEKQRALTSAFGQVLQVVHMKNWHAAQAYHLADTLLFVEDESRRSAAIDRYLDGVDAQIPATNEQLDLLELTTALTRVLRDAGFTAKEISELIDDGRGGTVEQQVDRVKSRFSANVVESMDAFWRTVHVKGKSGPSKSH